MCEVPEDAIRVVDFLTKFGCGFIGLSEPFLELRHRNTSRVGLVCRVLVDYVEGLAETTEIATTRTVPIESFAYETAFAKVSVVEFAYECRHRAAYRLQFFLE